MDKTSLELADDLVKAGVDAEREKAFDHALSLFQQAIECFIHFVNYEASGETEKVPVRKQCVDLLDRSEAIKSYLKKGGNLPKTFSTQAAPSVKASNNDSESDEDGKKLNAKIKNAVVGQKFNISYDDIVGLKDVKSVLNETVVFPLKYPTLMSKIGAWKGILLFGPPGVGKTLIAKAVASECDSTLFSVSSSDLGSKYVSESECLIGALFNEARKRRPSIIFIDEVEWICSQRKEGSSSSSAYEGRQKTELLQQMDGTKGDNTQVLVLAATNLPRTLDDAFLRRFDLRIYVPLPDLEARVELFKKKLESNQSKHSVSQDEITELGGRTENYNASDIESVVRRAKLEGIYKVCGATHFKEVAEGYFMPCSPGEDGAKEMRSSDIHESKIVTPRVSYNDVMKAFEIVKPSRKMASIAEHEAFNKEFGLKAAEN